MPILRKTTMIFTFLTITALIMTGCSDNSIINFVDDPGATAQAEAVESYFPLNTGYTSNFDITYQSGGTEQVSFRAGRTVSFQGVEAIEYIGTSQNSIDTGYFYPSGNTLYYYASTNASPEKVLQLPFANGSSWATNEVNSDDFIDIITGYYEDKNGNTNSKNFPTISSVNFTVESTENLELNSGDYFSQTVRISSPNGSRMNYYWYAQGIGLVRYVIGASDASYPDGDIVGEISNYGYSN